MHQSSLTDTKVVLWKKFVSLTAFTEKRWHQHNGEIGSSSMIPHVDQ